MEKKIIKKRVKCWAVIAKSDGWLFCTYPLAEKRPTMHALNLPKRSFRIVPCTITYQLVPRE